MLKLKLQYFGHLMQRADSLEKTLMLGKTEGRKRRGWQRMRWLDCITDSLDMNRSKLQETVKDRGAWCASVHGFRVGHNWATEKQQYSRLCFRCWGYYRKDNKHSRWGWTLNMNMIQNMNVTKHNVTWYSLFSPLWPRGLYPARLLRPWDFPGKNTVMACRLLLQGIFPTQRSNPVLLHCRWILYYWAIR